MRRRLDHLLEVVENHQELAVAQRAHEPVAHGDARDPEARGNGGDDGIRIADRCQGYPHHAVGKVLLQLSRDLERQPGLADPTWARQCQQADRAAAQQSGGVGQLLPATDQRGERQWRPRIPAELGNRGD